MCLSMPTQLWRPLAAWQLAYVMLSAHTSLQLPLPLRSKLRREMNQTDQAKSARATDALLNYETVKYCEFHVPWHPVVT
jgi:ABC-type transport system involved in Fe-S cluster assembly fused permease/ATPase subunit